MRSIFEYFSIRGSGAAAVGAGAGGLREAALAGGGGFRYERKEENNDDMVAGLDRQDQALLRNANSHAFDDFDISELAFDDLDFLLDASSHSSS